MTKTAAGPVSAGRLKSFVERIEKLREEKKAVASDERDVFSEAKGVGYDAATIRWILKERELDAADRAERDSLRDTYAHALGMAVESVSNGEMSLRQAAKAHGVSKSSIHRALAVPAVSREMVADDLGTYQEAEPQGRAGAPSKPSLPAAQAVDARPPLVGVSDGHTTGQGGRSGTHSIEAGADAPAAGSVAVGKPLPTPRPAGEAEIAGGSISKEAEHAPADRGRDHDGVAEGPPVGAMPAADEGSAGDADPAYGRARAAAWTAPDPVRAERKLEPDDDDLTIPPFLRRQKEAA